MGLENEIKRIKSLFTEERLYGNLINEDCADCDDCSQNDMANYLNNNGYFVKKVDSNTTIDNESCKHEGEFYDNVYPNIKNVASARGLGTVELYKDGAYGCSISISYKSKLTTNPYYINLQLWSDGDYIMTKTYYEPFQIDTNGNELEINKLFIEGKWEWQTDHIEFKGNITKIKKVVLNSDGSGTEDKIASKKYQNASSSENFGKNPTSEYSKFEELIHANR